MTLKKAIGKIHLWLGLASGLVVFIVALTGCIYVFQKEISDVVHRRVFHIDAPAQAQPMPLSVLRQKAQAALGADKPLNFISTYRERDKAWEFSAYKGGDEKALTYFGGIGYYQVAYMNPYTGQLTGLIDYKYEFFNVVKFLHWSLLLNTAYGQPVVGVATLIFVLLLITGMILWWPKNLKKANVDKSFKIKWGASFKRVNYDLHNVPGFYAMLFAVIIALTGLVWAFDWFQKTVYVVASRSITPPDHPTFKSVAQVIYGTAMTPFDKAFLDAQQTFTAAEQRISVSVPGDKEDVTYIYGYRGKETYYDADELQYDQYSGRQLHRSNFADKNAGEKIIGMNYDIHVGAILGLPGKIIAFFASLVAASLPVTGTLIWIGRKKKKKKPAAPVKKTAKA
jgi:uncharacterized iron-regulated membrane protein